MFLQLFDPDSSTFTYVLSDARTREAVIIDPVLSQRARDLELLRSHGLKLRWVLDTHVHADHVTGANALKAATGARTAVGEACDATGYDRLIVDGDTFGFGDESLRAIATPGHTPGSTCFTWRDRVFTGDTLLIGGCGRTDFQNGDARALYRSLMGKVMTLPAGTLVFPAHDYRGNTSSTIGAERASNPRLAVADEESFVALMGSLNLQKPKGLDEAVPLNRIAGVIEESDTPWPSIAAVRALEAFAPADACIADLRDPRDRELACPAKAVTVNPDDVDTLADMASRCARLYLVCSTGRRSMLAARALAARGITNAIHLSGGLVALEDA